MDGNATYQALTRTPPNSCRALYLNCTTIVLAYGPTFGCLNRNHNVHNIHRYFLRGVGLLCADLEVHSPTGARREYEGDGE